MIYAINNNIRVEASRQLPRASNYRCPHCKSSVILKKGEIKIPHFAHKSLSNCEHEPESDLHIAMKKKVASMLNLSSDYIEYGIKNVRCDVYDPNTNTAYEIQCSPLTLAKMRERYKKYVKLGINQVWLFPNWHLNRCFAQYYLRRKGIGVFFNAECELIWRQRQGKSYPFTIFNQIVCKICGRAITARYCPVCHLKDIQLIVQQSTGKWTSRLYLESILRQKSGRCQK